MQRTTYLSKCTVHPLEDKNPHHTLLDSHLSCRRSRPPHHTSSPGAYKECCCTGTHPGGSVYPLKTMEKSPTTATCARHLKHVLWGVSLLPPLSHFSSSLPSKQSGSASQCHRSGMQWPFLHWYWSLSHFTSQPFCANTGSCALAPRATVGLKMVKRREIPRPIRQHNRGRHRTSSGRRYNARSRRQTRSPNTAEALGTQGES